MSMRYQNPKLTMPELRSNYAARSNNVSIRRALIATPFPTPGLNESIVSLIFFDACYPQSFSET